MYSETITIFNRSHSRNGDIWYPHILNGVDVISDRASIVAKYGSESKDNALLHIKYSSNGTDLAIGGKRYLSPKVWGKLSEDEKASTITLNGDANYFDFFILGEYEGTGPVLDNDYTEGFYHYMDAELDDCFAITSVSNPYRVIPHFEILAK